MASTNQQLSIEYLNPSLLSPNPWNCNEVSPDNEAKLVESIKRFGFTKPVICRQLPTGAIEILGGEHRVAAAARLGITSIPIVNLGDVDEKRAKEISLIDNGRYGTDNTLQLAELLEGLGDADELANFMPYSESDIASIFSSVNIALNELDILDSDELPPNLPTTPAIQTHQIMRFKVPVEDVATVTELVERTMKVQKFTESDSLANAGDALVYLMTQLKDKA